MEEVKTLLAEDEAMLLLDFENALTDVPCQGSNEQRQSD